MAESRFWRLCAPNYNSDYDSFFINGTLEHPYGLPGVECATCGETWSNTRVLPVTCPQGLRQLRELNEGWPISADSHRALRERIRAQFVAEGHPCPELAPGDDFQPAFLDVPSTPSADFLWASLGSVVISERMRPSFEGLGPDVARILPVQSRKIGVASPELPAPIPQSGEPFDLLAEARLRSSNFPSYFELVVSAESGPPHGPRLLQACKACGRVAIEGTRRLAVYDDMAPFAPLFRLATTLWLIVTDAFKSTLEQAQPSNIRFEPVGAENAA
jgi:hypothetical protein